MKFDAGQSDLAVRLEKILQQRQLESTHQRQKIRLLLNQSVEYGRAERVIGVNPNDELCHEYVDKVITNYNKYNPLISCLEKEDPEAWSELTDKMFAWANGFMRKHNIHGPLRQKSVKECVPNAIMTYLSATYHYDTDFFAWVCVLVRNVCYKFLREQNHPNQVQNRQAISYEEYDSLLNTYPDANAIHNQKNRELRFILLDAIESLSSNARKELIIYYYFSGYSFKEIATEMNKSLNAIYKLHFDALNELRKNLG